jgi:hypothetical protein
MFSHLLMDCLLAAAIVHNGYQDITLLSTAFVTMTRMTSLGVYAIGTAITGAGFSLALQCLTSFFGVCKRSTEDECHGHGEDRPETFTELRMIPPIGYRAELFRSSTFCGER